ncbi:carbohydrate binding protein [Breznakibacter xylanolyticus]|uniref:endo-1,4-beta-xylanase n=1 Tax=Breznakibacter xylanolyticus TaxID=990 RepID=A0A2W7P5C2_9BACT|nr:endo-1,4-beta-xylanase [Breznakibacter xylanolyticus]PZX18612.1 carbohydrate binding protein [Breznakibacter xylanolyticus]
MKLNRILPALAMGSLLVASCDESKMEWETRDPASQITTAEIPLAMAEKISRYKALNEYAEMKLGIGIDLTLYMEDEVYANIVNENFDEITIGYHMKHGPMVTSKGDINFNSVDEMIAKLKENGLGVYGHTLVWHQNQNASYLNGLIAPTIIPGPAGSSAIDISGLEDGTFTGWERSNPGAGITIVDGAGLTSTSKAIKLISSATSSAAYNLQIKTPSTAVVKEHNYELSFWIKSEQPGKGRISFAGLENNYPYKDWYATGGSWTEAFETTSTWQQVKISLKPEDFKEANITMNFDLGYLPDVTYYIDVPTISLVDKDGAPIVINLIGNGNFEGGNLDGWGGWGNESTRAISAEGEGYGNKGYSMVLTNPTAANNYSAQQVYTLSEALTLDQEYTCTFWVKATTAAKLQVQIQNADYNGDYYGGIDVGTTWIQIEKTIKPSKDDRTKFIFDFGETACTFYIDDIVLAKKESAAASPKLKAATANTIIEKTAEEKTQLIGAAMESWIKGMMEHYKGDVKAWDVVNEPIGDNAVLRDGNVSEPASDEFYWVKYLGKDYAVTAFKLARQYGNAEDVLFINDYNLEHNIDKCKALIEYVTYIEEKGAKVDGIGTQMHININTNKENIKEMFTLLAATGKQVRITELDVQVQTDAPSADHYQKQAEMYQFVVDQYKALVPAAQQFGITVWGVSDNEKEHEHWIPDDAPNLWDAKYERKMAYKYFADGLAGKDVSADFSGELEYDE